MAVYPLGSLVLVVPYCEPNHELEVRQYNMNSKTSFRAASASSSNASGQFSFEERRRDLYELARDKFGVDDATADQWASAFADQDSDDLAGESQ